MILGFRTLCERGSLSAWDIVPLRGFNFTRESIARDNVMLDISICISPQIAPIVVARMEQRIATRILTSTVVGHSWAH